MDIWMTLFPKKLIECYRVVKCDVIKKLFSEILNLYFIFRKSIKNNVKNGEHQLNMLNICWEKKEEI